MDQFPREYFIEIEKQENFLGRLTLNFIRNEYLVEIDIVLSESKKIYKHIDILYHQQDQEDAMYNGVQRLATFLKQGL